MGFLDVGVKIEIYKWRWERYMTDGDGKDGMNDRQQVKWTKRMMNWRPNQRFRRRGRPEKRWTD